MSAESKRLARAEQVIHERARLLAAQSIDAKLEPNDAKWLSRHLDSCEECAAVADEYRAIHAELRALPVPEPPRDLWARTSAALDRVDAGPAGWFRGFGTAGLADRRPLFSTVMAVAVVVVVAVGSLLAQSPILAPGSGSTRTGGVAQGSGSSEPGEGPQAPIAVVAGTSYWMSSEDGVYEIKGGTSQCTGTDGSCTVTQGTARTLAAISSTGPVSAVIAPDASRAAVWTKDKIVIVPLTGPQPQTAEIDKLTPRPTATATPVATPSATPTAATPSATPTAATPSATPAATPSATPVATPTATPAASASTAAPTAILSGYEIVGRDPEFSADGQRLAFSARPADLSTGPNVFVWQSGQEQARAVTFGNADLFGGWYGLRILISEISVPNAPGAVPAPPSAASGASQSTSYVFDPATDTALKIDRPMLLPVVDPTGRYLVFWSGIVEYDAASGLWQPGRGDLYFDTWADLTLTPASLAPAPEPTGTTAPSAPATASVEVTAPPPAATISPAPADTPAETAAAAPSSTASPEASEAAATQAPPRLTLPQPLPVAAAPGMVHTWVVRWDATGRHVAVWVADPGSARIGRLSLFSVNGATGFVDTNEPLLAADKVMSNVVFDRDHLVYTSAVDGKTYMPAIPAVPPSSVTTPPPATPGASSGSSAEAAPASVPPGS
jgi:hypothetical protein